MILKTRKCKVCGTVFQKKSPLHSLCSGACAIKHMDAANAKRKAKELADSKRETKAKLEVIKPRAKWLSEAQAVFNKFIRLRDENLPCISCGRFHAGQYHAGHYRAVGSAPHLRFHEQNCHKQCAPCNNHLSGNIINYRTGLIKKIGIESVESLEGNQTPAKYTIDDIKQLIAKYKLKLKQEKEEN